MIEARPTSVAISAIAVALFSVATLVAWLVSSPAVAAIALALALLSCLLIYRASRGSKLAIERERLRSATLRASSGNLLQALGHGSELREDDDPDLEGRS